jgi:hypothetical protein
MKLIQNHKLGFLYLQELIARNLTAGTPFLIGRLSGNESRLAGLVISKKGVDNALMYRLLTGAGLKFNRVEDITDYVKTYNTAVLNSTALGVWDGGMYKQAEDYYKYLEGAYKKQCFMAQSLEPFYYMDDEAYRFDKILAGAKIAIISSHKASIESQIRENRLGGLFEKPILPLGASSDFTVIKPPVQLGESSDGRSWREHFEEFKERVRRELTEKRYDIVFVSCGGYGMPISDFIYTELKTSVIYVGGPLQLYFGVRGKRWETNPKIKGYFREGWIDVKKEDIPVGVHHVEGGCYW